MSITDRMARRRTYPYTNARVRAMRGNLLTDSDYKKLAKMELAEIAEFLSSHGYGEEIQEFGGDYEGEELLERALKRNLANTYQKLVRIAPDRVQHLLNIYYRKFDTWNLKLVLRRISRGRDTPIEDMLLPTRDLDLSTLQQLQEYDTLETVLNEVQSLDAFDRLDKLIDDPNDLQDVEDALDTLYYRQLVEDAEQAGRDSDLFQRFLHLEAAVNNILVILRMKQQDYDYEDIMDRVIELPRTHQIVDNRTLARAGSVEDALDTLNQADIMDGLETDSITSVRAGLERYKLERGIEMLHIDQLSVNPILGFMICKEIEHRNLRMIVRAREENLGKEFINTHLVTGVAR